VNPGFGKSTVLMMLFKFVTSCTERPDAVCGFYAMIIGQLCKSNWGCRRSSSCTWGRHL